MMQGTEEFMTTTTPLSSLFVRVTNDKKKPPGALTMNWTAATSKEAVLLNCAVPIFGSILLFCELIFFF